MDDVTILAVRRVEQPPAHMHRLVAYFDCRIGGVRLAGCSVQRRPSGGFVVHPPRLAGAECPAVSIVDEHLMQRFTAAALEAFRPKRSDGQKEIEL